MFFVPSSAIRWCILVKMTLNGNKRCEWDAFLERQKKCISKVFYDCPTDIKEFLLMSCAGNKFGNEVSCTSDGAVSSITIKPTAFAGMHDISGLVSVMNHWRVKKGDKVFLQYDGNFVPVVRKFYNDGEQCERFDEYFHQGCVDVCCEKFNVDYCGIIKEAKDLNMSSRHRRLQRRLMSIKIRQMHRKVIGCRNCCNEQREGTFRIKLPSNLYERIFLRIPCHCMAGIEVVESKPWFLEFGMRKWKVTLLVNCGRHIFSAGWSKFVGENKEQFSLNSVLEFEVNDGEEPYFVVNVV